jgi:hypothetical protein
MRLVKTAATASFYKYKNIATCILKIKQEKRKLINILKSNSKHKWIPIICKEIEIIE